MAIDLLASPSFSKGNDYPDYYTMMLDDVLHGRPIMSEKLWNHSQEFCSSESSFKGNFFVPENYGKCVGRALRLAPLYRRKSYLISEAEGYEEGPY